MPASHTLRIYPGGQFVAKTIAYETINEWITDAKIRYPNCILYIDGERISNGPIREGLVKRYDAIAEAYYRRLQKENHYE